MTEFTASNAASITTADYGTFRTALVKTVDDSVALAGVHVEALREFFQHERDEELGRWRWPANPDYVVYAPQDFTHYVRVVNERDAFLEVIHRTSLEGRGSLMAQAARAFFEAHPERKPWEDAKPGEVWILESDLGEMVAEAGTSSSTGSLVFWPITGEPGPTPQHQPLRFTSGRRIWPEETS